LWNQIAVDGPYGAPSSHIFHASHAVLIAAGIGVTPFASILQSIMNRYYASQQICPRCEHCWSSEMPESIMNLKKVKLLYENLHSGNEIIFFLPLVGRLTFSGLTAISAASNGSSICCLSWRWNRPNWVASWIDSSICTCTSRAPFQKPI